MNQPLELDVISIAPCVKPNIISHLGMGACSPCYYFNFTIIKHLNHFNPLVPRLFLEGHCFLANFGGKLRVAKIRDINA